MAHEKMVHVMQQEIALLKQQGVEKESFLGTLDSQLSKKETELGSLKTEFEAGLRKIRSLEVSSFKSCS